GRAVRLRARRTRSDAGPDAGTDRTRAGSPREVDDRALVARELAQAAPREPPLRVAAPRHDDDAHRCAEERVACTLAAQPREVLLLPLALERVKRIADHDPGAAERKPLGVERVGEDRRAVRG